MFNHLFGTNSRAQYQLRYFLFLGQGCGACCLKKRIHGFGLNGNFAKLFDDLAYIVLLDFYLLVPFFTGQALLMTDFGEANIGIVLPQEGSELRPGSKHPVRLFGSFGNQVVNQYPDIGFASFQNKGLALKCIVVCIHSGHQSLTGSLFISSGAVDLSRKE